MADTIPVRAGEGIDLAPLEKYLRSTFRDLPSGELELTQFPTGASNLTYALKVGDWEAVLRRPPLGPVAPKAHDMGREFRVLQALVGHFQLAPKPLAFCDDHSVLGAPFFLMERRHGIVLNTDFPTGVTPTRDLGRRLSQQMVNELVGLHQVDYTKTDLVHMTRPEGFMKRQVDGWISRYNRAKTDDVQGVEELMKWLADGVPEESGCAIIHYDYKFNNAMFNRELTQMVGLFDWEMTTVGDPLADLGAAMSYWLQADDPEMLKVGLGKPPITIKDGFFTRREFIEAYAQQSGRDVSRSHFYVTFAFFKLAVIIQQIYYRYKAGQTNDSRFMNMNHGVAALVEWALQSVRRPD
ncbi:phosphotransferase family protein [Alicyclobacillus dauci]|uniref:Phosphotransferase family protein n=1 Tax=Alicyclobacillus dauci TaxID=1475485 RepID=A0ABY6Z049_9BACL|nr:phosphotransferase family protein [Alicyclobacillus dauci]WAH36130.1 phosphotransferase family protein [Alicyclobacillus dauci]